MISAHHLPSDPASAGLSGEDPAAPSHPGHHLDAEAADLSIGRLGTATGASLAGSLIERALGLGLLVLFPLLLTSDALGRYYEVLAVLSLALTVSVLGLDTALVRFVAIAGEERRLDEVPRLVRIAQIAAGGASGLTVAALWIGSGPLARRLGSPELAFQIRLGSLAVPLLAWTMLQVAPARGLKRMTPSVVAIQVVQPAVQLVVAVPILVVGISRLGPLLAYVLSAAAAAVVATGMAARIRWGGPGDGRSPRMPGVGAMLTYSVPVGAMALVDTALLWADTILLGLYRPAAEVGAYGVAVRLLTATGVALFAVIQAFGPFAAQLIARGDAGGLRSTLGIATRWSALLAVPILAPLVIEGGSIVAVLGQGRSAGPAIAILAAGFLADAATGPVGHVLTMAGRSRLTLANNLGALGLCVGLDLVLIPRFGAVGAAAAWAGAIGAVNVIRCVEVYRLYGVFPFSSALLKPLAAGVGATVIAVAARSAAGVGSALPRLVVTTVALWTSYAFLIRLAGIGRVDRAFLRILVPWSPKTEGRWTR